MKTVMCDKCGTIGRARKSEEGPRVVEVKAGLHNGGRVLDLCGDCRKGFHALIDEWLDPASVLGEVVR